MTSINQIVNQLIITQILTKNMIKIMIFFKLIIFIRGSYPEYKGYVFSNEYSVPNIEQIYLYSPKQVLVKTSKNLYMASKNNISHPVKNISEIGNVTQFLGLNPINQQVYLSQNNKVRTYIQKQAQPDINLSVQIGAFGSQLVRLGSKIYYTNFMNMIFFSYDIQTKLTKQGPRIKYEENTSGAQMAINNRKKMIAFCDSPYFMILDEDMNIIQSSLVSLGNIYSIKFTEDASLILLQFHNHCEIMRKKQNILQYERVFTFWKIYYTDLYGVTCGAEQNQCYLIQYPSGNPENSLIKRTINVNIQQEKIVSTIDHNTEYSKLINGSKYLIRFHVLETQIQIFSLVNYYFEEINRFKTNFPLAAEVWLDFFIFSNDGQLAFYAKQGNRDVLTSPYFGVWSIVQDRLICEQLLQSRLINYEGIYDQKNDIFYLFSIFNQKILAFNASTCKTISEYSPSSEEGKFTKLFFKDQNILYAVLQNQKGRQISHLDSHSLQQISTHNLTTITQIIISHSNQTKFLGTQKNSGKHYLVLYDSEFNEQQTLEVLCIDTFNTNLRLSSGADYFRVMCIKQMILYDSSTLTPLYSYYAYNWEQVRQTFTKQLIIQNYDTLRYSQGNIVNRQKVNILHLFQKEMNYFGNNILYIDSNLLACLMVQIQTNDIYLVKATLNSTHIIKIKVANLNQVTSNSCWLKLSQNKQSIVVSSISVQHQNIIQVYRQKDLLLIYQNYLGGFRNQGLKDKIVKDQFTNHENQEKQNSLMKLSFYIDSSNILYIRNIWNLSLINVFDLQLPLMTILPATIEYPSMISTCVDVDLQKNHIAITGQTSQKSKIIELWSKDLKLQNSIYQFISSYITKQASKVQYSPFGENLAYLQNSQLFLIKLHNSLPISIAAQVKDFHFLSDRLMIILKTQSIGTIHIYDISSNVLLKLGEHQKKYERIYVSPSNKLLISKILEQNTIEIYNIIGSSFSLVQQVKTNISLLNNIIVDDNGNVFLLSEKDQKIQSWTIGECLDNKILSYGFCKCPQFSSQSSNHICQCNRPYMDMSMNPRQCMCPSSMLTFNGNCCPPGSIDFIDGSCLCIQGYYQSQVKCERCSFYCEECTDIGFDACNKISILVWVILGCFSIIIVAIIGTIICAIIRKRKIKSESLMNQWVKQKEELQ